MGVPSYFLASSHLLNTRIVNGFWHSESTLWILERKGSRAHVAGMTSSFFSRFSICLAFRVGAVFCLQQLNKLLAVYAQGACL